MALVDFAIDRDYGFPILGETQETLSPSIFLEGWNLQIMWATFPLGAVLSEVGWIH